MLDYDLALLYEIETRVLKQAVKRNINRFPDDFMFELSETEIESLVSQFVIPSKSKFGGSKPFAFTEQGIAMLSSNKNQYRNYAHFCSFTKFDFELRRNKQKSRRH